MSIDNTRKFIEKAGCGHVIGIGIAIALLAGMFTQTWNNQGNQGDPSTDPAVVEKTAFAEVDGQKVSTLTIQNAYESTMEQMRQPGPDGTPPPTPTLEQRAYAYSRALDQSLQQAALLALATKAGFKATDENLANEFSKLLDQEFQSKRAEFVKDGTLKASATEAEFAEAYKKKFGQTPIELRERQKADLARTAADPTLKNQQMTFAAFRYLMAKESDKIKVTEDDLKINYTTYNVKILNFPPDLKKPGDAEAKAAKVAEEIKKGMTFEAAMDKYSMISPEPGKKKSERIDQMPGSLLVLQPDLAPIKDLKAGQVSGVIMSPGGPTLYKLVSVKLELPKDYEATKASLMKNLQEQKAGEAVTKQIEAFLADDKNVKWLDPGFQIGYQAAKLLNSPSFTVEKAEELLTRFDEMKNKDQAPPMINSLVFALASQSMAMTADAVKKKQAEGRFLKMAESVLRGAEDSGLRLRMARIYMEHDSEEAGAALLAAANTNSDFGPQGQSTHSEIYGLMDKLKSQKLLSAELEKAINEAQTRWKTDRESYEKAQANAKAEREKHEAEAKARLEAERKAAEAEKKTAAEKPPVTGGN